MGVKTSSLSQNYCCGCLPLLKNISVFTTKKKKHWLSYISPGNYWLGWIDMGWNQSCLCQPCLWVMWPNIVVTWSTARMKTVTPAVWINKCALFHKSFVTLASHDAGDSGAQMLWLDLSIFPTVHVSLKHQCTKAFDSMPKPTIWS